jgi:predicted Zn-ribbon and HTH transcriptional regulator
MGKASKKDSELGAVTLTVPGYRCRCGHEWIAKAEERPRVCPKCKSPRWDQPKLWERAK